MNIYLNPYRLFDLPVEATVSEIAEYKERLLRSLRHYGPDDKVYVQHSRVPKKVVLQLFREIEDFELRSHHQTVFQNKKLLNFLEYGQLNYFRTPQAAMPGYDGDFYTFIAPYFAYQYGETLTQAIQTQNKEVLEQLAQVALPRVGNFEEQCYRHANEYVEDTIQALRELQEQPIVNTLSKKQLIGYLPNRTVDLYNLLPDYFYAARNLIGNQVYHTSLALMNQFHREDAAALLISQGLKLRLDKSVRLNLESLNKGFKMRHQVPSFLMWGLAAVLLLFALKYLETRFMGG